MSKMQSAMPRSSGSTVSRASVGHAVPAARRARVVATHTPVRSPFQESVSAVMRVRIMWFALLANTVIIPALIIFAAATFDVVPWKQRIGAFIIAVGAISICVSFPFADKFRSINVELIKESERYRRFDPARGQKLMRLLFIGAICAELPSIAGMIHFFATGEIIASVLLCAPAIGLMLVAFHPVSPDARRLAPKPTKVTDGEKSA